MISANELRRLQISKSGSGYNVDEVNNIINEAAKSIDAYDNENREVYRKMEILAKKIEEYRAEENSIKSALITAEKMAEQIKNDSNKKAADLISDSEAAAEKTIAEANAKADEIISQAREYSSSLIKEKTIEANTILSEAEKKANDAVNSSKTVAQDILAQAKSISEDLVNKAKEQSKAYELLISALKGNAKDFIDNLVGLYSSQLDALNNANLETSENADKVENIQSIQAELDSLENEVTEIEQSIPEEVVLEKNEIEEESDAQAEDAEDAQAAQEEAEAPKEIVSEEVQPKDEEMIDKYVDDIVQELEETVNTEFTFTEEDPDDISDTDPMQAVEAFSNDEITPVDTSVPVISEIDEEPEMVDHEESEKSLFDDDGEQLPFETYFNVNKEDAHGDPSQTISLVPPEEDEDDDQPKFKGFFKKKK